MLFEKIKYYYEKGYYSDKAMVVLFNKKVISKEQYLEILEIKK